MFYPSTINANTEDYMDKAQRIGEALAQTERWKPFCESIEDNTSRSFCAVLLENQFQHFDQMNETTKILQIGNFDKFAFPIIRAVYPNLVANDLCSVQPMPGPVSLVFYLDFIYGSTKGNIASGGSVFDSLTGPANQEYYSSQVVTSETITRTSGTADMDDFIGTAAYYPIIPGTMNGTATELVAGTVYPMTDDGAGTLVSTQSGLATATVNYATGVITLATTTNDVDDSSVVFTYEWDSEGSDLVPQIDLQLTSSPCVATIRKLRSRWSLEAANNLSALHGLDAEAELVGVLAEVIKFELDRSIINAMYNYAGAGTTNWDKATPAGVSYNEHKQTIVDAFVQSSNQVFSATQRAQTNWIVCGVGVCNVVESLPTFVPAPNAFDTQSNTGIIKIGRLNNRWDVYKDPSFPSAQWMTGYKGGSFLDAGYVYAPYIPLFTTPTVILDDFLGRKGMATQYGTKAVNPNFYATGTVLNP
jgi:hypothetical protein